MSDCDLPALVWARLRIFSDGSADACWENGGKLYGFDDPCYAGYFLSEDEYRRLAGFDADDEREYGIPFTELPVLPLWIDSAQQAFKYFGTY